MATPVNDLLRRLQAALNGEADQVPEGHRTSTQWAKQWGVCVCQARRLIAAGIKSGLMQETKHRINNGKRGVVSTLHYFEKNDAKPTATGIPAQRCPAKSESRLRQ